MREGDVHARERVYHSYSTDPIPYVLKIHSQEGKHATALSATIEADKLPDKLMEKIHPVRREVAGMVLKELGTMNSELRNTTSSSI